MYNADKVHNTAPKAATLTKSGQEGLNG